MEKKETCNLSEEIIFQEILPRLPIKFLVRFRSVCKSWNTLIASNPQFAALQLKNSVKTDFDRHRVLVWNCHSTFLIDQNPLTNSFSLAKINVNPITNGCTIDSSAGSCHAHGYSIVASCSGLVCVRQKIANAIVFWNPLTGETKKVVEPPMKYRHSCGLSYCLGYDLSTDDYKLVRLCHEKQYRKEVSVYSLRTNSWRKIQDLTCECTGPLLGIFNNGTLFWTLRSRDSGWKVVSFDMAEEKFRELELPRPLSLSCCDIAIGVLDEKLCLYHRQYSETHNLWLVDKYNNSDSWTKYEIKIPSVKWYTPLSLFNNGEELLLKMDRDELVAYHLEKGTYRDIEIPGMTEIIGTTKFLETLISPEAFKGINN